MLNRLLLTGAAGGVASALRPFLSKLSQTVLLSDISEIDDLMPHETFRACDLSDRAAVNTLVEGADGIIHLGGVSVEKKFDLICDANIVGVYNMFEASRRHGKPRIVYASSNHVTGFYRRDERVNARMPTRPDSLYGVSKVFGEGMASLYFDKFGVECLSVRIGWCFPKPKDMRTQVIYLAAEDLFDLCVRAFEAPRLGHTVVYGVSNNEESWWDNSHASFLGWQPKHSSAKWRAEILASAPDRDPLDPAVIYQGGAFVTAGHPDDDPGEQT